MKGSVFFICVLWFVQFHVLLSWSHVALHSFLLLYFSHLANVFTPFVNILLCFSHNGGLVSLISSSPFCVTFFTPKVPAADNLPVGTLLHIVLGSIRCEGLGPDTK